MPLIYRPPKEPKLIRSKGLCVISWTEYSQVSYDSLLEVTNRNGQIDGFFVVDTTSRGTYREEYKHFPINSWKSVKLELDDTTCR